MTRPRPTPILVVSAIVALTFLFFWKILLTNLILVGVDTFLYFYPYKAYASEALRQGRLPLWNPHLFMGAPLLANSQVGLFYPFNWLFIWFDPPKQVAWSIALHIVLAGTFMIAYARRVLGLGWTSSLVTAIVFAFGGYLGAQVEHINQLNVAVWLPLLFLLYDLALAQARRRWLWLLCLALVAAITLLAGHAQTVYISLFGLGLYAVWQALSSQRSTLVALWHYVWPLVVVSVLAVALASIQLFPTAELSALSIRSDGLSFREAVSFSLRPSILHLTIFPPFGLDLSQTLGQAFGEWVAYIGVSGLMLVLLGLLQSIWRPAARRFVFLAGAGLLLSLGMFSGPLYLALYYVVPGFGLFRVPARWLLLYAFATAVLAGFGFEALFTPATIRTQLDSAWNWLRARWWRLGVFMVLPLLGMSALIVLKTPPTITLISWPAVALIALGLIYLALRFPSFSQHLIRAALLLLLITELFFAAQTLNYNHPTAPQAYHSLRNAIAFLLAADSPTTGPGPPDRFLSLSAITYDPGDLADLEQIYGDFLSPKAFSNLIVATKQKEVLFFNLPLVYGLHSVDGYDGGILPLDTFVTLQQLFLPPDDLSLDGRLREKLRFVPEGRLLSLLNTRWIITDKQFDVWIDGIFYDLQFPARLAKGQSIATAEIPSFPTTALGVVSHLESAADLPADTPVAELTVTFAGGATERFVLTAGRDTAEGSYPVGMAAHPQARVGVAWPYQAQGVDYLTVFALPDRQQPITQLSLTATLPRGQFVLRGLSLIHQPTRTSRSILLTTEGHYRQVHSGDVKIYENLAVLPRVFLVHQVEVIGSETAAIAMMQHSQFDPAAKLVRLPQGDEPVGLIAAGQPSLQDRAEIVSYEPERVEIAVRLSSPGWLILTDSYYRGWQATLDGQPVEISRAYLMFRSVAVPAGEHTVLFQFKPRSFHIGAVVSAVTLILVVGGLVITGRRASPLSPQ